MMNKFLFASLAVLCTLFTSCSNQEYILESESRETATDIEYQLESRSVDNINVSFTDTNGASQTIACLEARLTYLNTNTVDIFVKYDNGTSQSLLGNNVDVIPTTGDLLVTINPNHSITTSDVYTQSCRSKLCYTYNNGNNVGTTTSFIIEEEPTGY